MANNNTIVFSHLKSANLTCLVFIIILTFPSFGQMETELILPDSNIVFTYEETAGVIFGMNFKWRFRIDSLKTIEHNPLKVMSGEENAKRYMPDFNQTQKIEISLKSFLQDSDKYIAQNLQLYTKQYYGYITSTGDSIIWINCFYDDRIKKEEYWKRSFVNMFDGGHYYFKVRYNLTKKEFFDLWINGF